MLIYFLGKSVPTTATIAILFLLKKDAQIDENVADPPSISSFLPKGVSIESIATDPTITTLLSLFIIPPFMTYS